MSRKLKPNPSLPFCPTHDHGNIYSYERNDGEIVYRCVHQEHDPKWGSGDEVARPATRNSWSYDELQAAAQNKKSGRKVHSQVVQEEQMDTTDTTPVTAVAPTDSTAMNVTTVVARAKEKGMSLKEFSAKANVNLGSVYNALRAHKEGKVIYSAKFIAALEKALTD